MDLVRALLMTREGADCRRWLRDFILCGGEREGGMIGVEMEGESESEREMIGWRWRESERERAVETQQRL